MIGQGFRVKILTVATLAIVFASGGLTGYVAAARDGEAAEAPRAPGRRGYVFEQFERTEEQQAQIDAILRANRKRMSEINAELEQIRQEYQAASDSVSRETGEAISLVFPPEIRAEYLERLDQRRAERTHARQSAERGPRDGSRR